MSTGHAGQCYPWALSLHVNRSCWPVLPLDTVWSYMSTGHAGQCYPWVLCGVTCQPVMLASVIPGHCVALHVNRSCWPVLPLGTVWSYMSTGHASQCYPWVLCGVTCQPVMLASVTPGYCVELHVNRSCWPVLSLGTVWS